MAFDPISTIGTLVTTVVDKIFPDATKKLDVQEAKNAAIAVVKEMQVKGELDLLLGQLAINQEEAKSQSVFVAGWRPFIGWVCGIALGYYYVAQPFLIWGFSLFEINTTMPTLELGELMTLLLGMLGLAGMRSYDKQNETPPGKGKATG
jgi:hypothetical protein